MKNVTVTAHTNQGGKKVKVGERIVQQPETLAELQTQATEEQILKQYWKSEVIDIQARIRSGAEEPTAIKQFKTLDAEKQAKLLELAKAQGLL